MAFNKCSIAGKSYGDVIDPVTGEVTEVEVSVIQSVRLYKEIFYMLVAYNV